VATNVKTVAVLLDSPSEPADNWRLLVYLD
jgi:hypothetical protein